MTDFTRKVDKARIQFFESIYDIADKVRSELVIPFCEKKNYKFRAGMGTWSFWDSGGQMVDDNSLPEKLEEVLNLVVTSEDYLGEFVIDYPEEEGENQGPAEVKE